MPTVILEGTEIHLKDQCTKLRALVVGAKERGFIEGRDLGRALDVITDILDILIRLESARRRAED